MKNAYPNIIVRVGIESLFVVLKDLFDQILCGIVARR